MLLSRKSVQILNVNDLHQCWVFDDTYHNCVAEIRKCAAHEQNTKFADKSSSQSSLSFSYCAIDPMYQRTYSFFSCLRIVDKLSMANAKRSVERAFNQKTNPLQIFSRNEREKKSVTWSWELICVFMSKWNI